MAETLTAPPEAGSATIEDRLAGVESEVRHLRERMDYRLDAQDKSINSLRELMDARFDGVSKQFGLLKWILGIGFSGGIATLLLILRELLAR